ncbi:MAG: 50S ribosomal protein L3 [Candidatus ainarchaeum sp.]|nr:50S ribosomal protein L3 [Candidatus ainarchaeum sp.]
MTDIHKPRRGSLAFRPRKRAYSQMPSINAWPESKDVRLLGAAGYKAGMTQICHVDDSEDVTKGQEVTSAVTVVEIPPMFVYGFRGYKHTRNVTDVLIQDEAVLKKLGMKKAAKKELTPEAVDEISLLVFVQPDKTGIGKKHPERMEIRVGGGDVKERIDFCKGLMGKELSPKEIFKPGEYIDVVSITKGKGWQGAVKRFGIALQRPKATGKRRHAGTLGQWHPGYILYTAPRAGQMGYHKRTELNKRILKIGENVDEINPDGGFPHYGFVKNNYILIKGSVPGPVKRLIRLRLGMRGSAGAEPKITQLL